MSRVPEYRKGISQALESSDEGKSTLEKICYGELRAVQAAGVLALMKTIYSPDFDFVQACETANRDDLALPTGNSA